MPGRQHLIGTNEATKSLTDIDKPALGFHRMSPSGVLGSSIACPWKGLLQKIALFAAAIQSHI